MHVDDQAWTSPIAAWRSRTPGLHTWSPDPLQDWPCLWVHPHLGPFSALHFKQPPFLPAFPWQVHPPAGLAPTPTLPLGGALLKGVTSASLACSALPWVLVKVFPAFFILRIT